MDLDNVALQKCQAANKRYSYAYEALSDWGSGKVLLDIIFKVQEKVANDDFQYHRDIIYSV